MLGEPLENATIVLEQGRIVRVEQNASLSAVDLGDRCIVPRFVNSHTHLEFSGLESPLPCSDSFAAWIGSVVQWRRQQQQMLGDQWVTYQRRAIQQGIEECRRCGTGLMVDMTTPPTQPEWLAACLASPPIAIWALTEWIGPTAAQAEASLTWSTRFNDQLEAISQGDASGDTMSWLKAGLSPHAPYTTSIEMVRQAVALSQSRQTLISMHLAETMEEIEWLAHRTGPLQAMLERFVPASGTTGHRPSLEDYLRELTRAPKALIAHGNYLRSEEINILAEHRQHMAVVYCPRTHSAFGHAEHPWRELRAAGIPVLLGTDSRASNPNLNILEEAKHFYRLHPDLAPRDVLAMITTVPAEFLGVAKHQGTIHPGLLAPLGSVPCTAKTPRQVFDELLAFE